MNARQVQGRFLKQVRSLAPFRRLMEHLPDVYFFVKNRRYQLMMGNKLFLVKCGVRSESEIIGKSDRDFFAEDRIDSYHKDDHYVMTTGKEIVNRVELSPDRDGALNWFITTKIPLYSTKGKIIGLAAVARDGEKTRAVFQPYFAITGAVQYIRDHYQQPLEIKQLASLVNLSTRQFERKFRQAFNVTPATYIGRIRVEAACELLRNSSDKIASIAQQVGFYDQSHMVKTFIKVMGISPTTYKKNY